MKVLLVDNHDSFTYNLAQLIGQSGCNELTIVKNDQTEIDISLFDKFIFSPGPGIPSEEGGLMKKILYEYSASKSILGICLGHQAIAEFYGASLMNMDKVYHGIKIQIKINDNGDYLFRNLPEVIEVGLYHSWCVNADILPECLQITAMSEDGIIMAIAHKLYDVKGLQFHPESIMTVQGLTIIKNWLRNL
jgi:anthranilate synthase component II